MKPHNPDNLTPEQVGVSEGWRLLDEDEVTGASNREIDGIQLFLRGREWWGDSNLSGNGNHVTYRTKLTREELAEKRGLKQAIISHGFDEEDAIPQEAIDAFRELTESTKQGTYDFSYKGIRLDPYRIESVCGPWHPAQAHAIKKLMRAGKSVKPLIQDIDEAIATLNRWKQMIQEDEE